MISVLISFKNVNALIQATDELEYKSLNPWPELINEIPGFKINLLTIFAVSIGISTLGALSVKQTSNPAHLLIMLLQIFTPKA